MEEENHVWRSELEEAGHRLVAEGASLVLEERVEDALVAFDGGLELAPALRPYAWQRGFALYYAGRYEEAAVQFALNSEVDPDDMEPVFWKFLCDSRCKGMERARVALPEQSSDARPVMIELLELYHRGEERIEQVILAAAGDEHMSTVAHFYCGLYLEALGKEEQALTLLERADESAGWEGYVGKLMGVHLRILRQRIVSDAMPLRTARPGVEGAFTTPAIIKGSWQLAEGHHGEMTETEREAGLRDMKEHVCAGVTAMDCGDIYTVRLSVSGVEELIGRFLREHRPSHALPRRIQVHTKFVPDLDQLATMDEGYVRQVLERSLNRLGIDCLDLVQFHWWDYSTPRYIEVAKLLASLQKQHLFRHLGLTNFDLSRTKELVEAGVPVAATQVQLSPLDRRAIKSGLVQYAQSQGIAVLAYGVLAGGFLTDAWLGKEEPKEPHENRSLTKYHLIIIEWGGWARFQGLLTVLRCIADSLGVAIAEVVIRWTLDQPGVTGCIIGARDSRHLNGTVEAATNLQLQPEHHDAINRVLNSTPGLPGEVYGLEREEEAHNRIMRYNLSRLGGAEHLEELVRRFLDGLFFYRPHEATKAGFHKYDWRLPSFSDAGITTWLSFCRRMIREMDGIQRQLLSPDQFVDLELMRSHLKLEVLHGEEGFSIEKAVTATFEALSALADERDMGEQAPGTEEREELLERRLRGLAVEFFGWGAWDGREGGRKALLALASYIRDLGGCRGGRIATVCVATAVVARVVAARAEGNGNAGVKAGGTLKRKMGVGREKLREMVRWRHHMATKTAEGGDVLDELLRRAEERFRQVEARLAETAEMIEPGKDWKEVAKGLRNDHPRADDLLPTYLEVMDRAFRHVMQTGHVRLPDGIVPRVEGYQTPEAQRPFTPFGDFHNPAPFSTDRTGYLMLHPLAEDDEGLRDHDIHWIEVISMHEFYPGHYQQSLIAQCHARPLRRWFISPLLYEGWGLYVEQLGLETGFYSDPLRARLTQLRLQLWRTARVILDIKLNCGEMTYEQCCQFLQDNVLFSPQASKGEAMMYVIKPGYAISYLCGFDQIITLREERRRALGEHFTLAGFHDELLRHGTIPISLIRYLNEQQGK